MNRDSFDAANKIKSILPEVFDDGYIFASFNVEPLFTNMPLQRTINIILDRVYNNKPIATQLKEQTLKKKLKKTLAVKLLSPPIKNFTNRLMVLVWVAPLVYFLQTF